MTNLKNMKQKGSEIQKQLSIDTIYNETYPKKVK